MEPVFFTEPKAFRAWLEKNHATADELLVGFYKKASGRASITWPESVDQALCYGWIDGVRRSLGEDAYTIRFTPRTARSIWSAVNIARAEALAAEGLMQPAGLAAFERRDTARSKQYSFEQKHVAFEPELATMLKANAAAAQFFHAQPAGYRKTVTWWVMSAKRAETRMRRMKTLVDDSARGERIAQLRRA